MVVGLERERDGIETEYEIEKEIKLWTRESKTNEKKKKKLIKLKNASPPVTTTLLRAAQLPL